MPVPKKYKELLTAKEKERLSDFNLDPLIRKRNDLIVRNKVLSWIKSSHDALFALERVSTKKLKEEIDDDYIYLLLEIVKELLDLKDFGKPHDIGKEKAIVVNPFIFHSNSHNRGGKPHIASHGDLARIFYLESALEDIISLIPQPHQCYTYDKFKRDCWEELAQISANATTNGKKPSQPERWNQEGEFYLYGLSLAGGVGPDIEKSIECFDKSLEANPNYVKALENKQYALRQLGRLEEALMCSEKLLAIADRTIKTNPSNAAAWFLKGQCLLELGKSEEEMQDAVQYVEKAAQLNPYYKNAIIEMHKQRKKKNETNEAG